MNFGIKQIRIQNYQLLGLLAKCVRKILCHTQCKAMEITKNRTKMKPNSNKRPALLKRIGINNQSL